MTAPTRAERRSDAQMEYGALKPEQTGRIGTRDGMLYITAIIYGWLLATGRPLLVPVVAWVFGWTYLRNDEMVSAIGRYLRESKILSVGWEQDHQDDKRRLQRKVTQLAVDLTWFPAMGTAALVWYWSGRTTVVLLAASAAMAAVMGYLAWQFAAYSGLPWPRRRKSLFS
jgi:hypothetical protein